MKWQEQVYETGKNLETPMSVTLKKNDLGMPRKMELSQKEVVELLKPAKNDTYTEKHID